MLIAITEVFSFSVANMASLLFDWFILGFGHWRGVHGRL